MLERRRMNRELKPCLFCGKCPEIAVCDNEGNVRGEDYERDPWSGLGYRIVHISEDCPVATDEDGGSNIYDTREEAERHWNRRAERTCQFFYDEKIDEYACSACGERVSRSNPADEYKVSLLAVLESFEYCPNCGAKVVDE